MVFPGPGVLVISDVRMTGGADLNAKLVEEIERYMYVNRTLLQKIQCNEPRHYLNSVESHTGILNWLPICAVQAPGIDQVPLLVRTTRIRYWFLPMSGYW